MNTENDQPDWNSILKEYFDYGFNLIPLQGKEPIGKWKSYQQIRPTWDQIQEWIETVYFTGWGVITGKVSGVIVVDVDLGAKIEDLELSDDTSIVQSGNGGLHYYYRYSEDHPIGCPTLRDHIHIRGDRGIAVIPPSIHPITGEPYKWLNDLSTPLAPIPDWVYQKLAEKKKTSPLEIPRIVQEGSEVGSRNIDATSLTGYLLRYLPSHQWESVAWPLLQAWNQSLSKPLEQKELATTFLSIYKAEETSRSSQSVGYNHIGGIRLTEEDTQALIDSVVPIDVLLAEEIPTDLWLIKDLIPKGGITCIAGYPKVGKSFLMLDMVRCLATGSDFLGQYSTQPSSILIISKEDARHLTHQRADKLGIQSDMPIHLSFHQAWKSNPVFLDALLDIIRKYNSQVVIFDSFIRLIDGDENSSKDVTKVQSFFKHLTDSGMTVIFTHHYGKAAMSTPGFMRARGSSDIPAMVDSLLAIEPTKEEGVNKVTQEANRCSEKASPFEYRMPDFEAGETSFQFVRLMEPSNSCHISTDPNVTDLILDYLSEATKPVYQKQIYSDLQTNGFNGSATTFKAAIKALKEQGKVLTKRGSNNGHLCWLPNVDEDEDQKLEEPNSSEPLSSLSGMATVYDSE